MLAFLRAHALLGCLRIVLPESSHPAPTLPSLLGIQLTEPDLPLAGGWQAPPKAEPLGSALGSPRGKPAPQGGTGEEDCQPTCRSCLLCPSALGDSSPAILRPAPWKTDPEGNQPAKATWERRRPCGSPQPRHCSPRGTPPPSLFQGSLPAFCVGSGDPATILVSEAFRCLKTSTQQPMWVAALLRNLPTRPFSGSRASKCPLLPDPGRSRARDKRYKEASQDVFRASGICE